MSSSEIEQIKERLAIADVIGSYIQLQKAGKNFKARCPFHNEKTPSFTVSPDRGTYHCFGCQRGGDILSFVQEIEGIDFPGALHMLAERAGVTIEKHAKGDGDDRKKLFAVMQSASKWYERNIYSYKNVGAYLKERGLTGETAKLFAIGYAPDEWRSLSDYLLSRKYTYQEMEDAGLVMSSAKGYYDRFRGRVMFPIFDSVGRAVAFSGRIFEGDGDAKAAKYVNSPETKLYNKSDVLYGFHLAKNDIRTQNTCILVEGQMDIIMSHQAGVKNCVAVSGTALTEYHLKRIQRLAEKVIFAFDGDEAGEHAADRAIQLALSMGFEVRVVGLPKGADPADYIKEDADKWKKEVEEAKDVIEYKISQIEVKAMESNVIRKKVRDSILPFIAQLRSTIDQGHYISLLANILHIKEDAVWEDLKNIKLAVNPQHINVSETIPLDVLKTRLERIIFRLVGLVEWIRDNKMSIERVDNIAKIIKNQMPKEVSKALKQKETLLYEVELYSDPENDIQKQLDDLYSNYIKEYLHKELELLSRDIAQAQQKNDTEVEIQLMKKYHELLKQKQ